MCTGWQGAPSGQLSIRVLSAPQDMAMGLWACRAAQSARVPGTRVPGTWPCVSSTALPARWCHVAWGGHSP